MLRRTNVEPASDRAATLLQAGLRQLGLAADERQQHLLLDYLGLLQAWNRRINLTAIRDLESMVVHHLLDSLAALVAVDRQALPERSAVLDVGSGAGLPGVVWAVMRPRWTVCCVDAVAKKVGFIRQVAAELGLPQLQAVHGRIEQLAPLPSALIVSRAFASLADFVALSRHHLLPTGSWLAMKGRVPEDELATLPPTVEVFHVEPLQVPGLDAQRCLIWMRPAADGPSGPARAIG